MSQILLQPSDEHCYGEEEWCIKLEKISRSNSYSFPIPSTQEELTEFFDTADLMLNITASYDIVSVRDAQFYVPF